MDRRPLIRHGWGRAERRIMDFLDEQEGKDKRGIGQRQTTDLLPRCSRPSLPKLSDFSSFFCRASDHMVGPSNAIRQSSWTCDGSMYFAPFLINAKTSYRPGCPWGTARRRCRPLTI
ncbi:hypothetical protein L202_06096 [Cryptococcus amylolentus CBS 6039]|uniref:Uncharacterized protein n=1 Tax=Cryptococcus amylolentus CBS 6039 TaxID=1295533 RepID=A0A1E3HIJ5_9TREE|nr:hypothetical protein L202_06096 [Cryptococcus amylolentus CBS 6039]ODN76177.1 hypothetical protein L202_06096 [Cryptococcus amylolentus CBS 6039]